MLIRKNLEMHSSYHFNDFNLKNGKFMLKTTFWKFLRIQPSTKHYVMMVNPVGFTEAAMKRGDTENSKKMHLNRF